MAFTTLLFAEFKTLTTDKLQKEMKNNNIIVIDIRRDDEFKKYGTIKNSYKLTFFDDQGKYDINSWMGRFIKIVKTKDTPFVLVCAHSNRTKVVGKFLSKQLNYTDVYELDGGINYGWLDKGLKTVK
jgi:rhodanese-related sulfurtransferase